MINGNGSEILIGSNEGLYSYTKDSVKELIPKIDILHLSKDKQNNYWLSTNGDGLFVLDSNYNITSHFFKNEKVDVCYNTIEISDSSRYVATSLGLYQMDYENDKFKFKKKSINDLLFLVTKDKYNTIWYAGTNKIYSVNKEGEIKSFGTKDGLSSTLIFTLTGINNTVLVGSNLGLEKIITNSEGDIVNTESLNASNMFDGVETNTKADYVDSEGNLYLGTVKGLYKYFYKGFVIFYNSFCLFQQS